MRISKSLKFICSKDEFSGVKKIAGKVMNDVKLVFDFTCESAEVAENEDVLSSDGKPVIVFGTVGKSSFINKYLSDSEIKSVEGKREVYCFKIKENMLIIAGSEKRGTIYGLFHFSELIGVSPLVDWADALPAKKESFDLNEKDSFVSKEPSVRFRGFFINDEWPAFGNWANHNFGGVNAKMYEHVFELLLRMKGNYLWPAMWASRFSDDGPGLENAELADELGVIMGASHHEPCCRAGEEYKYLRGPGSIYGDAWNFRSNQAGITKFWEDGLKRNGKYENVITVGMRGEADTAILGKNATLKDNIDLLRDVLKTQNDLIRKYVNPDVQKVPRMLALYKEVEPYYYGEKHTKGLMGDKELEGVTLMLCDDNHGNLRTVPTPEMRNHKGGFGMYYHFDYHGWPYSYEWFNTNYLPKVKEQMCAAYDFGIRELWIVNVGDIATNEFPLNYFLDLAYDYEKYSDENYTTQKYTQNWIDFNFNQLNEKQKKEIYEIINTYTKLTSMRRTECLWPETYHPVNYGEADFVLEKAENVLVLCEKLKKEIPSDLSQVFYEQIYLPAMGNMNVLKMQLLSGKNHWYVSKGIVAGNAYIDEIKKCLDFDKALIAENDNYNNGKFWAEGWSEHFGFTNWNEEENRYPVYYSTDGTRKPRLYVWLENDETLTCGLDWTRKLLKSYAFNDDKVAKTSINLATGCVQEVLFELSCDKEWLSFEINGAKLGKEFHEGKLSGNDGILKVDVVIDRELADKDSDKTAVVKVFNKDRSAGGVLVNIIFCANVCKDKYVDGAVIQTKPYICIEADQFICADEKNGNKWKLLPEYGKTSAAVKAFPVINSYKNPDDAPFVEYAFVTRNVTEEKTDVYAFDFYLNPSNPAYKDNTLQFIAEINGEKLLKDVVDSKTFAVGDNQQPWGTDITNNIRVSTVYAECKEGLNYLKVFPVTPNIVLEKIVIRPANVKLPSSYLGPR